MRIAVVHNALGHESSADEADVRIQALAVRTSLEHLGHETLTVTCDLNLERVRRKLCRAKPHRVFNLVESLSGTGRLIHLFPCLLDSMGMAYTGATTEGLLLTSNKILAKCRLESAGIPTPPWCGPSDAREPRSLSAGRPRPSHWIIKSVWEHASIGIDAHSLVPDSASTTLTSELVRRAPLLGGTCFAEAFIEGREFNISILDGREGPEVLPPAEIRFESFAEGRPRIVDYRAKWDPEAHQYHHTPRCFIFAPEDRRLLIRLEDMALQCWRLFDLRGYARVDFRVDATGNPWVLEINANPCLSPDAGFAAALEQAGIPFDAAMERVLESASVHGVA